MAGRVGDHRSEAAWGVNDRVQLAVAERIARQRINEHHMRAGVTIVDPAATYIDYGVEIGCDTTIWPGTVLSGRTRIGRAADRAGRAPPRQRHRRPVPDRGFDD